MKSNCNRDDVMMLRNLPIISKNYPALSLIANGGNIWAASANQVLKDFRMQYLIEFASFPTNTQFVERGVKESGYVSLGRRGETNRSILAIARGKILPEALQTGRDHINSIPVDDSDSDSDSNDKMKQLQGKRKIEFLMRELQNHQKSMTELETELEKNEYTQERSRIYQLLTQPNHQFKKKRIEKKINHIKDKYNNTPAQNVYERRHGQTLTPLIIGKIQIHKMKKTDNFDAVRNELMARGLGAQFDENTTWTKLLTLLKKDEGDKRYFTPRTSYDSFKWLPFHYENPIRVRDEH